MYRPRAKRKRRSVSWKVALTFSVALLVFLLVRRESKNSEDSTEAKRNSGPVTREDLLVVIPSDEAHLPLVRASRRWRQGVRTLVAVNDTKLVASLHAEGAAWNETWAFYPDDVPLRANYPGDTRAAIVPFLAHQLLGRNYKWLLYGDDDTQWFLDGVLRLVNDLEHDMPYFVTDNLWWSSINGTIGNQPNLEAPRCLPCNYHTYGIRPAGEMQFPAPEGCPCRPQALCEADQRGVFAPDCSIPRHLVPAFSTRTYSMHGGAGGLMSVGLLQAVSLQQMEACIASQGHSTGGDSFITICLWKLGFAHTDPGPWFNDLAMRLFDGAAWMSSAELAAKLRAAGGGHCADQPCELFDHMVSSHIHSRKAGSIQAAADAISQLSEAYQDYVSKRPSTS